MEYRRLGRTDLQVGVIGLGTEHLLLQVDAMHQVLGLAVNGGVNYVDLLYVDAQGNDAEFWKSFGPVLKGYRDRLVLAAHWGGGLSFKRAYSQRCFDDILSRACNGYADIAMLTMVDTEHKWKTWAQEAIEQLRRYQEQGRVGYIGMSSHRAPMVLKALDSGMVDVIMYPLNMTSHLVEPERALCDMCFEADVGLVAMKPYRGGTLFVAEGKRSGITPAQCLHYVLSLPVSTTVPGPRNAREMYATLHYLTASEEEKDYRPALAHMHRYVAGRCTGCNHCLPCPQGIDVAQILGLLSSGRWGLAKDSDQKDDVLAAYAALPVKASACVECGDCEARCPFGVEIVAELRRSAEIFEGGVL